MELELLAAMVGGGVATVVVVTHLATRGMRATLASDEQVRATWAIDDATPVTEVQRATDGRSALLALQGGQHGVVFALGDRWVCRRLAPGAVRRVLNRADRLTLRLTDFAAPTIHVPLGDPPTRVRWQQRLES